MIENQWMGDDLDEVKMRHTFDSATTNPGSGRVRETPLDFTRLFYMLYNGLDTQITLADTKSQLIVTANTILLATIPFNVIDARRLVNGTTTDILVILFTALMLCCIVASVLYALLASRPNLIPPVNSDRNLFFFGHIVQMDIASYQQAFLDMTMDEVKVSILGQIYARSKVVNRKYLLVRRSLNIFFLALLFWIFSRVILSLALPPV